MGRRTVTDLNEETYRAVLDGKSQAGYALDAARRVPMDQQQVLLHLAQAIERLAVFLGRAYLEHHGRL